MIEEQTDITSPAEFQGPPRNIQLRAALVAAHQLKLLVRRARCEERGFYSSKCLSRLLEVSTYLQRSLEWVDSEPMAEIVLAIHYAGLDGISAGNVQ